MTCTNETIGQREAQDFKNKFSEFIVRFIENSKSNKLKVFYRNDGKHGFHIMLIYDEEKSSKRTFHNIAKHWNLLYLQQLMIDRNCDPHNDELVNNNCHYTNSV